MRAFPPAVFFALFALSGLAGLIYQSIWSQYLRLLLGHAAYAQTLVLAIFMGGMSAGAWLAARHGTRLANPLMGYALAELAIGVLALVFDPLFRSVAAWAFDAALPALPAWALDPFRWTTAAALILPASVLLGATFPFMAAGVMRRYPETGSRPLAMLYFSNSFGAALGVLASGFFLIDRFGLAGTILAAGAMNIALAVAVAALAWQRTASRLPSAPAAPGPNMGARLGPVLLALAFATGAASFAYEIAWIRMLSLGLGASTHAFEVMVSAFILGMAAGAFWLGNRLAAMRDDLGWLAALLLAKALAALLALHLYPGALELMRWTMQAVSRNDAGYVVVTLVGFAASLLVMFPAAFCAGMTLPLATHALTARGHGEAAIGRVYAANTAGCILGAVLATHVGMEALGVKGITGAGAALDAAAGGLLLLALRRGSASRRLAAVSVAALAIGVGIFATARLDPLRMASGVFRYADFIRPEQGRVAFYRDGKTATISIVEVDGIATVRTNGKPDSGLQLDPARPPAEDEATLLLLAALPLAMKPDAAMVANIGFGTGVTTHALLASPNVRRVDTVEIERAVVQGARHFQPRNARAYEDPRSRIHYDDAKAFFAAQPVRYDVIVSEPSNPWVSGVSTLFSQEFYARVASRLQPNGLLVQWIHAYELDFDLLASIFKALGAHFSDYAVYAWNPGDLYVVATPQGTLPGLDASVLSFPLMARELERLGIVELQDLASLRVAGRRALEPLFQQSRLPPHSDYLPLLDQRAPRTRFRRDNVFELQAMRGALEPTLAILDQDARVSRARASASGPKPPRVARAAAGLEAVDIIASTQLPAKGELAEAARLHALALRTLLSGCRGAEGELIASITQVSAAVSPYLAASEMDAVFDRVRLSPCWQELNEPDRHRIALLRAINRRDAPAMADHAAYLLRAGLPRSDQEYSQLVVAAILGLVAQQRESDAVLIANRFAPSLSQRERQRLLVRLTGANLRARSGGPPPVQ